MKCFLIVLILSVLAFADNDGCTEIGSGSSPQTSDGITLTLVNNWRTINPIFGLDVFQGTSSDVVLGVDNINRQIRLYNVSSGATVGAIVMDNTNEACFGVAWNNDNVNDTYYTNDWEISNLFFTDDYGSNWSQEPNPAGTDGRGMDFDGTDYWITSSPGNLWRFQPGIAKENITIPVISDQPSGLTVFPRGSNVGIAVTIYAAPNIYVYEWDGSTLTFLGSAACPVSSVYRSYGLAYNETSGNIFWSYCDYSSVYHLAELSFDLVALEHSSWGAIKSSF